MHIAQVGQLIVRQAAHVRAGRLVAHHQRVGLRAVDQAERHPGIGGMEQRALPLDRRPNGRARWPGDSHSTAPDTKSETTASIETPSPAIRMPVWPVARKSALMPRRRISLLDRQRGEHLADRAIGADGQQPLAAAASCRCRPRTRGSGGAHRRAGGRGDRPASRARPACRSGGGAGRSPDPCRARAPRPAAAPSLRRARRRDWRCRR